MSFVTPELCAIGERLRTQDNRCTADPIFMLRGKRRIYGMDPIYTTDVVWIDTEEGAREVPAPADPENPGDFVIQTGYCDVWEVLMVAFTEEGIKRHLELNGHNYRHYQEVQIYADSLRRCPEMIAIREALMALPSRSPAPEPAGALVTVLEKALRGQAVVYSEHGETPTVDDYALAASTAVAGALRDDALTPERLAAIIREVDGEHSLGAAALAEAILGHPGMGLAIGAEPVVGPAAPSDEEIHGWVCQWWESYGKGYLPHSSDTQLVKDALTRFGTTPTPISVATQPLVIVFDGPPGPEMPRIVEVETLDGYSVCTGEWKERSNGLWGLFLHGPTPSPCSERLPGEGAP
jgi:hypothetical protein